MFTSLCMLCEYYELFNHKKFWEMAGDTGYIGPGLWGSLAAGYFLAPRFFSGVAECDVHMWSTGGHYASSDSASFPLYTYIKSSICQDRPVFMGVSRVRHGIMIVGYDENSVFIHDPGGAALMRIRPIDRNQFQQMMTEGVPWSKFFDDIAGAPTTVVIRDPQPLPMRQRKNLSISVESVSGTGYDRFGQSTLRLGWTSWSSLLWPIVPIGHHPLGYIYRRDGMDRLLDYLDVPGDIFPRTFRGHLERAFSPGLNKVCFGLVVFNSAVTVDANEAFTVTIQTYKLQGDDRDGGTLIPAEAGGVYTATSGTIGPDSFMRITFDLGVALLRHGPTC